MYSVYPAVEQRSDSLVYLRAHDYSDPALSGVTGFYPQFLSHTDSLHLQQNQKPAEDKMKHDSIQLNFIILKTSSSYLHSNTEINKPILENRV